MFETALRASIVLVLALIAASAPARAQTVSKITSIGGWALYADGETKHAFCFITSEPKSSAPPGASRDAPRLYISSWPKDGVKTEISFRMGFPVKKDTEATAKIDAATFKLFGSGDRVYVQDGGQELKLVEAMRKGVSLSIEATSERGTVVTDTYGLAGLGQALENLQKVCF